VIETLDPNLNLPPPLQPDAQQTEPIKPESVKIEEQKLERKKPREEEEQERKRRSRKDKVELSSQQGASGKVPDSEEEQADGDEEGQSEHRIDIFI